MENLEIYNKLKSVPQDCLKTIQAGRLKGMSDIKPQWRVLKMTEIFGPCGIGWKYKVTNRLFTEKDSFGQVAVFIDIDLFVKIGESWSDAIPGCGGSTFIANEKNGLYMSDEAVKMATTDALSVAMKMLGVGADVYMGHGGKYDARTNEQKTEAPQEKKAYPEDNRPWLSEKALTQVLDRIATGDADVAKKTFETFKMKKEYKEQINSQIEKYK